MYTNVKGVFRYALFKLKCFVILNKALSLQCNCFVVVWKQPQNKVMFFNSQYSLTVFHMSGFFNLYNMFYFPETSDKKFNTWIFKDYAENVFIDGCEHIDNNCFKRYINVFDFENLKFKRIVVCNEKIRLLYLEKYNQFHSYKCPLNETIMFFLQDKIKIYHSNVDYFTTRTKEPFAYIPCCFSPKLWHRISLTDYVKQLYLKHSQSIEYIDLCKDFIYRLDSFLERTKLKKNARVYSKLLEIKRSVNYYNDIDFLTNINDLFIIILSFQTK